MLFWMRKKVIARISGKAAGKKVACSRVSSLVALVRICCVFLLCWLLSYGFLTQYSFVEVAEAESTESNADRVEESSAQPDVVRTAFELIYGGKFDSAGELIIQSGQSQSQLSQLEEIVQEYEKIGQRRHTAQEAAYQEQLAELEKYRDATDTNNICDVNDIRDINDVNNLSVALSVIAKASEFADDAKKDELFSTASVTRVFQKAAEMAAEYESKGKWLDAYISCYYWLQMADPNNEAYSDHAEKLLDKASVVASFEDSPCETSEQRYEGVKDEIFVQAVDALDVYYVTDIDYAQMATKAIKRCEMLADVLAVLFSQRAKAETPESSFVPPHPEKLAAWSAALAGLSDQIEQSGAGFTKDMFLEIFEKILALNDASTELPREVVIAQFVEAAFSALDPYTVLIWPKQMDDFEKLMTNEFTGIGIEISKPKGLLTVSSLLTDTPAYKSGLDAGDVIEAVDGIETKDMSLICAVRKITGPKGTKVTLTIRRPGEEKTRDIIITRDRIIVPTIRGWQRDEAGKWLYMIDQQNKIGYVRITSFSAETASHFEEVLEQLEKVDLKGLILDLRFNTGGLLESAVAVANKFINEGLIVKTQPGFGRIPTYEMARKRGTHPDYPLVILIDSSSASASEIVAGALADEKYNRAILVGERTHGKGSVQSIRNYPRGNAQLKYTMAHYHLPSGQRVKSRDEMEKQDRKDWGIAPDIEVKLRSDELREMLSVQRDNDVLVQANRHEGGMALKRHTAEETLAADPQLAIAVLTVRTKLIENSAVASSAY